METELPKESVLLWNCPKNIKHRTKVFSSDEINLIFQTIKDSKDYYGQKKDSSYNPEYRKLLGEWMKARDLCIISFIYYSALRPGEACGLKFSDIDLVRKEIYINAANNKTKKDRTVRLCKFILPYYNDYLAFPKRFWKNSEYLFPSYENNHLSPERLKYIFRQKVLKKCGLYEPISRDETPADATTKLYSLRKSRATHLLEKGKDLYAVSNILGHADLRVTASYYVNTGNKYQEYLGRLMDDEVDTMKQPEIQINQQNNINFNVVIQQLTKVIDSQQALIESLRKNSNSPIENTDL